MHIDKRQSVISIRATHLYMEKHITSLMTSNYHLMAFTVTAATATIADSSEGPSAAIT